MWCPWKYIIWVALLGCLYCFHLHFLPFHSSERSQWEMLVQRTSPSWEPFWGSDLCRSTKGKNTLGLGFSKLSLHHEISHGINNVLIIHKEAFSWMASKCLLEPFKRGKGTRTRPPRSLTRRQSWSTFPSLRSPWCAHGSSKQTLPSGLFVE